MSRLAAVMHPRIGRYPPLRTPSRVSPFRRLSRSSRAVSTNQPLPQIVRLYALDQQLLSLTPLPTREACVEQYDDISCAAQHDRDALDLRLPDNRKHLPLPSAWDTQAVITRIFNSLTVQLLLKADLCLDDLLPRATHNSATRELRYEHYI